MTSSNVKYSISLSDISVSDIDESGKIPGGHPIWNKFTQGFTNHMLSPVEFTEAVCNGHAYTCWLDGRRKKENFVQAQHIGLDLDSEDEHSDITHVSTSTFVQMYGGLIHTSPSHTDEAPRCRVIFFLDEPVYDINKYEEMVKFMISLFGTDKSCKDATRFFYGNKAGIINPLFNVLPIEHLRVYYRRYAEKLTPNKAIMPHSPEKPIWTPTGNSRGIPGKDLVDKFNHQVKIEDVLVQRGYIMDKHNRLSKPSEPGSGGIYVLPGKNKAYSHYANDPLSAERSSKGQPISPFDVVAILDHNGDRSAAIKALGH